MSPATPRRTRNPLGKPRGCDACGGHIRDGRCEGCGIDLRERREERQRHTTIVLSASLGGFLTLAAVGLYVAYGIDGMLEITEGSGGIGAAVWVPFVAGPLLLFRALATTLRVL